MDLVLSGRPLLEGLTALVTSNFSEYNIHNLLSRMGGRGTGSTPTTVTGEKDFWGLAMFKEDGANV